MMPKYPLDTESQQYTIDIIIGMLHDAYVPLFEKKKELESLERSEDVEFSLTAVNFRIDALGKVETILLEPIKEIYKSAESIAQILNSEQRLIALKKQSEMMKHIDQTFVDSIMQGL
jgi:hypothetical protein